MKKIAVVLLALLLLLGSAYAERVQVCGVALDVSESSPVAYANATTPSGGMTDVAIVAAGQEHNITLERTNGELTLTLNNVTLKSAADAIYAESTLIIYGEGANVIESTGGSAIFCYNQLTLDGQFDSILGRGQQGIRATDKLVIAKDARIGDISGQERAIYGSQVSILIEGRIDSIGKNLKPWHGINAAVGNDVKITGHIGSIDASRCGIFANSHGGSGDIRIDGTVGEIAVSNSDKDQAYGIYAGGTLFVNNSVGPITVSSDSEIKASIHAGSGITLGSGVHIALPKNGEIAKLKSPYSVVSPGEETPATKVQFVKTHALPQTGDSSNLALWAALTAISVLGIAAVSRRAKKSC